MRCHGIATAVLKRIQNDFSDRDIWYVVRQANKASIRVAQLSGLEYVADAKRTTRFGMRQLGHFQLDADSEPMRQANVICFSGSPSYLGQESLAVEVR